jgi:hypothetical protein
MVMGGRRYADAAGLCNAFKPCRNIYAVPKNIMWLDDYVADIDADAKSNTLVVLIGSCKLFDGV